MKLDMKAFVLTACIILPLAGSVVRAQDAKTADAKPTLTLSSGLRFVGVSDDQGAFREHWWQENEMSGGVTELKFADVIDGSKLTIQAHGLAGDDDYGISFDYKPVEEGFFLRLSVDQFRKYFDDTGAYYESFTPSSFSLDEDLALDVRKLDVETGVTSKDGPNLTVGYEYQRKEGTKSLLEYNSATIGGVTKMIYPAYKEIDETTHTVKIDVEHTIGGVEIADSLRYEVYANDTYRTDMVPAKAEETGEHGHEVKEAFEHDQISNAITAQKFVTDTLMLSAGYMYLDLDGEADYWMDQNPFAGVAHAKRFFTNAIELDQESHLLNVGALFLPTDTVTISAGFQMEGTDTDRFGDLRHDENNFMAAFVQPELEVDSNTDKLETKESLEVRFAGIPNTMLYASAAFTQADVDLYEHEIEDGAQALLRDTEEDTKKDLYRVGFTISPTPALSLGAYYQKKGADNDYDHKIDEGGAGVPNLGYSAFILSQDLDTDELGLRLVCRLTSWLRATLKYQTVETDYETTTDPGASLGGKIDSGESEADVISLGLSAAPNARLYATATVSVQDRSLSVPDISMDAIQDYEGDVYSLLTSLSYACSDKTTAKLSYSLSNSSNDQDHIAGGEGLPLGADFESHMLSLGVSHAFRKNVSGGLEYRFYDYNDAHYDEEANYTAHGVFLGFTVKY